MESDIDKVRYPRPTGDMDIWIARNPNNAQKVVEILKEFGFNCPVKVLLAEKTNHIDRR